MTHPEYQIMWTGEELSLPKGTSKTYKIKHLPQMHRDQWTEPRITKNQVNMTPLKETNEALITNHKKMEIEEFRITLLKKLHELQEHTDD